MEIENEAEEEGESKKLEVKIDEEKDEGGELNAHTKHYESARYSSKYTNS